jgi:dipeptidyl aminopeptidase/acylaminoacyl peptidase
VEETNLPSNIAIIRKVLGDDASAPSFVETVSKRGYRFVASVQGVSRGDDEPTGAMFPVPDTRAEIGGPRRRFHPLLWVLPISGLLVVSYFAIVRWFASRGSIVAPHTTTTPFTTLTGRESEPTFSPDGNQIAFVWNGDRGDNADIYVKQIGNETPVRLTINPAQDRGPSWSPDGAWIYFCSDCYSANQQIWKMPVAGGQAVQVTRNGGFDNVESPDGQYLYFTKGFRVPGIWRMPVAGGAETLVLNHHRAGQWRYWAVKEQGIYFATAETAEHPLLEFFSFANNKVTPLATLEKRISYFGFAGLDVSPDGRWLIWQQLDQEGSDIMLMENFRWL